MEKVILDHSFEGANKLRTLFGPLFSVSPFIGTYSFDRIAEGPSDVVVGQSVKRLLLSNRSVQYIEYWQAYPNQTEKVSMGVKEYRIMVNGKSYGTKLSYEIDSENAMKNDRASIRKMKLLSKK